MALTRAELERCVETYKIETEVLIGRRYAYDIQGKQKAYMVRKAMEEVHKLGFIDERYTLRCIWSERTVPKRDYDPYGTIITRLSVHVLKNYVPTEELYYER